MKIFLCFLCFLCSLLAIAMIAASVLVQNKVNDTGSLNDIRQTGIGGLSGLSGISLDNANQQIDKSELLQEELNKQMLANIINQTNDSFSMQDYRAAQIEGMRRRGLSQEIELPEGFGDSRFDKRIRSISQLDDLNETRAQLRKEEVRHVVAIVGGILLMIILLLIVRTSYKRSRKVFELIEKQ